MCVCEREREREYKPREFLVLFELLESTADICTCIICVTCVTYETAYYRAEMCFLKQAHTQRLLYQEKKVQKQAIGCNTNDC